MARLAMQPLPDRIVDQLVRPHALVECSGKSVESNFLDPVSNLRISKARERHL